MESRPVPSGMAVAAADGDHPVSGNALCAELFHRPGRPCTRAEAGASGPKRLCAGMRGTTMAGRAGRSAGAGRGYGGAGCAAAAWHCPGRPRCERRAGGRGRAFAFCFCGVDSGRRIQSDTMAAERRMGGRGRGSCAVRYTAGRIGGDAWTSGKRSDRPLKWVRLIFLLSPACRLPIRWTAARGGWKRG